MEMKSILFILFTLYGYTQASSWNNLNCPAPRAPDNGLSFIFRNGELVHFRCHPGYQMIGKSVAYCVNNMWTHPAPECIPIRKWPHPSNQILAEGTVNYHNRNAAHHENKWKTEKHRQLFSWGDRSPSQNAYGDGPRRLPLINGIWPPQDHAEQVLALGPQSTPGPQALVKEEIDIAELRNKQLEELRKQRYNAEESTGRRRQGRKKNKRKIPANVNKSIPRETIISLGVTEDGQALSVTHAKSVNETSKPQLRHKHRHHHRGDRKKKTHEKKKKYNNYDPAGYFNNIVYSRKSRVDTSGVPPYHTLYQFNTHYNNDVAELRRRPVEQVKSSRNRGPVEKVKPSPKSNPVEQVKLNQNGTNSSFSDFDTSCVESLHRREVPMIAPQVLHGFVYRYERKKNKLYPFNSYMLVKYKCLNGYIFANSTQTLHCKKGTWIGEIPRCIQSIRASKD